MKGAFDASAWATATSTKVARLGRASASQAAEYVKREVSHNYTQHWHTDALTRKWNRRE